MTELRFGIWQASVSEECGSNLISLRCAGDQLLRSPQSLEELKGRPCLYGFPLILPANRVRDGVFSFEGKQYQLEINDLAFHNHIHGLIKDAPFHCLEKKENYLKTVLENDGSYYPFPFLLTVEDTLDGDGWQRRLTLENTGCSRMPYTLGFHATFREPECFRVPISQRYDMDQRYLPTGKLLPLDALQQRCRDGFVPDGSKINGCYTACGNTVELGKYRMTVSAQFDHFVLFNGGGGEGYLCIEPQCGAVNGLRTDKHRVLDPGERETFTIQIGL